MSTNNTTASTSVSASGLTVISGTNLANSLSGGNRSEEIFARDGNDVVRAGAGNDLVHAGSGNDTLYGGSDNDCLIGDGGNDVLYGEAGNEKLFGKDGDDRLVGGTGRDLLFGYKGNDVFVYTSLNDSALGIDRHDILKRDTPTDSVPAFQGPGKAGGDKFDFSALGDLTWGKSLYVKDVTIHSYVYVDKNMDGRPEIEIAIYDSDTRASAYTVEDFIFL
jgi:Ca2+-binding RTX toxin-like protein